MRLLSHVNGVRYCLSYQGNLKGVNMNKRARAPAHASRFGLMPNAISKPSPARNTPHDRFHALVQSLCNPKKEEKNA
jgi:hypothetical protein